MKIYKSLNNPISIIAISSVSPLGSSQDEIWDSYLDDKTYISKKSLGEEKVYVSELSEPLKKEIQLLRSSTGQYKSLDDSVLFAILAARKVIKLAKWNSTDNFGINVGSSRGATRLFESFHESFLKKNRVEPLSSPTTTLGNISSWIAQDLQTKGPEISHSITCSTALHAVLNGIAWINSGMSNKFLVGGSEAPLTPFTIAQMQALKIYAKVNGTVNKFPCKALDELKSQNTMVLGEGSSMACLEKGIKDNALAVIEGIGYATEMLEHNVSISREAECFKESMRMALGEHNPNDIDVIVTHTPGTIKGDLAELRAIDVVFSTVKPILTTNKWKVGHTLGTSGMLSLELAVLMLQHQRLISVPYLHEQKEVKKINKVLINAVGFGGNAVSILLSKH